jgi:hypothetical protein
MIYIKLQVGDFIILDLPKFKIAKIIRFGNFIKTGVNVETNYKISLKNYIPFSNRKLYV